MNSIWALVIIMANQNGPSASVTQWPTEAMCENAKTAFSEMHEPIHSGFIFPDSTYQYFDRRTRMKCVEVKS